MNGKSVIITGASRGIGRGAAEAFTEKGWNTCLICRDPKHLYMLEEVKELAESKGLKCLIYAADLSREESFTPILAEAEKAFGSIDVLINNAGVCLNGLFTDLTTEEWRYIMGNNLDSAFFCSRAVLKSMLHYHRGKILNVSSVFGNVGASCEVAYSTSKGAMNAMTRALAKEVGPSGISVNAVTCGMIDTEMNNCYTDEEKQAVVDEIPMCRMGTAAEVGEFLVKLAESPDYLTGQIISFDGGWF